MNKKILGLTAIVLSALCLSSCNRSKKIIFDTSDPLALTPGIEWAVVMEPYAAFRKDATFESEVSAETRRGEIIQVLGKNVVYNGKNAPTQRTTWYKFQKGWLDESVITVYDNKLRAETAVSKLKK